MCSLDSEPPLEPGLDIEEIEKRIVASNMRYNRDARTIAYYLLEVESRNLFKNRGFSSIYDFADKLIEIDRRKTQSLLTIARRLEELPTIAAAFDSGEIGWTKIREITKVATKESQKVWLEKARRLSCRELEKAVRRKSPSSGRFHTIQISMPESSEDWRDETVAAIFDGPPTERPEPPATDPITPWLHNYKRQKRKERLMSRQRRGGPAGGNGRDHVIAARPENQLSRSARTRFQGPTWQSAALSGWSQATANQTAYQGSGVREDCVMDTTNMTDLEPKIPNPHRKANIPSRLMKRWINV